MTELWKSWNGNISHPFNTHFKPSTEAELIEAVRSSENVRVIGNGYSSADIAGGTTNLISLENYGNQVAVNMEAREITVEAGVVLAELLKILEELKWTLPALPDIDAITVGGALATGTHGTGREALILAGYMIKCRVIHADGSVGEYGEDSPELEAIRVSLGVLGIFSTVPKTN